MSYVIAGRVFKNEHIALGVLTTVFGGAFLATRGSSKAVDASKPSLADKVKQAVTTGTSEEEELLDSIRKFVEDAEKEAKH